MSIHVPFLLSQLGALISMIFPLVQRKEPTSVMIHIRLIDQSSVLFVQSLTWWCGSDTRLGPLLCAHQPLASVKNIATGLSSGTVAELFLANRG